MTWTSMANRSWMPPSSPLICIKGVEGLLHQNRGHLSASLKAEPMIDSAHTLSGPRLPWWRIRMVWLVIGGPAVVVVAGVITMAMAVRGGDEPMAAPDSATVAMRTLTTPGQGVHKAAPR
jgi:hypothetical protein